MEDVESILITPAKKLDETQLKIVNYHREISEFWKKNTKNKSGISTKLPFRKHDYIGYDPPICKDDLDTELKSFLEKRDSALIPEELLYTNKVEFYNKQLDGKSSAQKLSAKLMNMEMKESEMKTDESDHEGKKKIETDNVYTEQEDAVGDYKYSFCEEEELDNENEYNY